MPCNAQDQHVGPRMECKWTGSRVQTNVDKQARRSSEGSRPTAASSPEMLFWLMFMRFS